MSTTAITIQNAADQLGLPEGEFRKLLTGIVKNPSTTKKISFDKFKMIAESLRSRAELEQAEQPEQLEADTKLQVTEDDTKQSSELATTTTEQPSELDFECSTENSEHNNTDSEHSDLATTTAEETQLDLERTRVQLNINLNLQNQVLDLNKITSALAVVAAEEAVKNFEEIYTHTLNTGVDRVLSKVAAQTHQTIKQLREVDNSDFLSQYGRSPQIAESHQAIDQVISLL